ncbi:hypothetical protein RUND412_010735 [Rhizina undulata]
MFGWGESHDAYETLNNYDDDTPRHESHFSHELISGAAAFGGFKYFEDQQRAAGKPVNHALAKEILAGLAGAEVDKLVETKGLDFVDREKAKHAAKKSAERMYDEQYGQYDQYDPNSYGRHERLDRY